MNMFYQKRFIYRISHVSLISFFYALKKKKYDLFFVPGCAYITLAQNYNTILGVGN